MPISGKDLIAIQYSSNMAPIGPKDLVQLMVQVRLTEM